MSNYHALTEAEAVTYAQQFKVIFPSTSSQLTATEIGDGNLNLVFRISDHSSAHSLILKQALPYAKVVGESWPLTLHRSRIESDALRIQASLCSDLVPEVYAYDEELSLTVMEDLSDHVIMRKGLMQQVRYPLFAAHISRFLANTLFYTSDLGLNQQVKKQWMQQFANPELCKITEDLIFDHPYWNSDTNHYEAHVQQDVEAIWQDVPLQIEVAMLRNSFLTNAQALLHGDLHTGSIFITQASTKVIDPEFAFYGPMGFDIGAIFANLLLNYTAQEGLCAHAEDRKAYREYVLNTIKDVWVQFEQQFLDLWQAKSEDRLFHTPGYSQIYMQKLLQDTVGFAGVKMIRRIIGLAHVADIDQIQDTLARQKAQRTALNIGKSLIKIHRHVSSIDQLLEIARKAVHLHL